MEPENTREREVLDKLKLEKVLPNPYKYDLLNDPDLNEEDMDIFDLARRKGKKLN